MSDTVPAYYVSTTGSDSNPGTLDAPFLTLSRAQEAMQSSSIKTTYIRAGDYSPDGIAATPDGSGVLNLGSSDSNETWSYYPADGYGSAHITGGGTITTFMSINGATGVTVNGLDISNFTAVGIKVTNGSSNATIINNTVHDMPKLGIALDDAGAAVNNTLVSNNYIYNIGSSGISIYSVHGNGNNNNTISNNSIVNAAYTIVGGGNPYSDSAGIYAQDLNATPSTGNTIINNYIGTSHGVAIYLDDGASNFTVTGNILNPGTTAFALVQLHGGNNNVFSGNIGDVSTGLLDGFVFYQPSVNPMGERGMTGNVWQDNILVGSIGSGGGNGYTGSLEPPAPLTIRNNDYWNYGAGGALVSTGSGGAGNDTNPTNKDPQLTGSTYNIAAGSPVFSSPVNFPGITGGWGPATGSTPPPPPPATLYGFVFNYNDGSYYFGTVADDGTYGYHTGETVFTSNTYGGNYYIYGNLGTTTNPVGTVHTTYYVDTTSGQGYDPYFYDHGNPADGSSGLGSEFDYTDGANGHQSYGGGGAYEAMQGGSPSGASAAGSGDAVISGGDPSGLVDAQEAAADLVVDADGERDHQHRRERELVGEQELLEDGDRQPGQDRDPAQGDHPQDEVPAQVGRARRHAVESKRCAKRRERAGRPNILENTSPAGRRMPSRSPGSGTGGVTCGTRGALGRPGRQPAGQPAELLASVLPEEGAGLAGAPEAGRLADQPRRRIAHHGCAQEWELVEQRRGLRVLEEGRGRRLAGGQVARAALPLALGLLARPRHRRPLVVLEDGAEPAQHRRRCRRARGERLDLAAEVEDVLLVGGEACARPAVVGERGEPARHLVDAHVRLGRQRRRRRGGDQRAHTRRLCGRRRGHDGDGALPGTRRERERELGVGTAHEEQHRLALAPRLAHHARVVAAAPRERTVRLHHRVADPEAARHRSRVVVHRRDREPARRRHREREARLAPTLFAGTGRAGAPRRGERQHEGHQPSVRHAASTAARRAAGEPSFSITRSACRRRSASDVCASSRRSTSSRVKPRAAMTRAMACSRWVETTHSRSTSGRQPASSRTAASTTRGPSNPSARAAAMRRPTSAAMRGCTSALSRARAAGSANTSAPSARRSIAPSAPTTPGPKVSTTRAKPSLPGR